MALLKFLYFPGSTQAHTASKGRQPQHRAQAEHTQTGINTESPCASSPQKLLITNSISTQAGSELDQKPLSKNDYETLKI